MSRQYLNASKAVNVVVAGKKSLKSYCSDHKVGKTEYALICETLKYVDVMEVIFRMSSVSSDDMDVDRGALLVYCYELLFGAGKIQGGGVVKRRLLEKQNSLRSSLEKYIALRGVSCHKELIDSHFVEHSQMPIYLRLNSLRADFVSAYEELVTKQAKAEPDDLIPNLVVLPHGIKRIAEMDRVADGTWVIQVNCWFRGAPNICVNSSFFQDKASCIPSQVLGDIWTHGDIIDACAAPGNKTSHLSALISEKGGRLNHIYAFDKSKVRWKLLQDRMEKLSAVNVVSVNADFLDISPQEPLYSNVTAALVDPSCSGSGVIRSIDRVFERVNSASEAKDSVSDARLSQLRSFQIKAILKAMTFPKIRHIVYSTCSVYQVWRDFDLWFTIFSYPTV